MSKCSAKNRRCAGGDEWCIGGTLRIEDGATLDVAEGATVNGLAAGGGGASTWDDLEGKPFGETVTYIDTLHISPDTKVDYQASQYMGYSHAIDDAPSYEDILKGTIGVAPDGRTQNYAENYETTEIENGVATQLGTDAIVVHEDEANFWGHTWKKGVWIYHSGEGLIPNLATLTFMARPLVISEIKTIEPKFLPEPEFKVAAFMVNSNESFELRGFEGETLVIEDVVNMIFKNLVVILDVSSEKLYYPTEIQFSAETITFSCRDYAFYIGNEPK